MENYGDWQPVIGLEIHTELNTKSKLFSPAPNRFGDEPNTNISPVCTGQPGALPVLNKEAVKLAVKMGCALHAEVAKFSKFDRKSYFYPDSPRNFQITQLDQPIILGGHVIVEVEGKEKTFEIDRAHLEDDAGMLKHFSSFAGVDYNRAGVPLLEIVSTPTLHSPQDAVAYAMGIKAILEYIEASDCNMEEGSLRFDANISVRKKGETGLRNKIEIKNMNSFNFLGLALEAEIKRQIHLYETASLDQDIVSIIQQATFRWDPEQKKTVLMRLKENADDYRYFPEPDLTPIVLTESYIEEIRATLPELPYQRTRRYEKELQLPRKSAFILTSDKKLADYFEQAYKTCKHPRNLCNWIIVEFAGRLKDSDKTLWELNIAPENIAKLVNMICEKKITGKIAKKVADDMLKEPGKDCEQIVAENPDYQPVHDQSEIELHVDQVLKEFPQSVTDYKAGKDRAFDFLVGQVMRLTRGKASPPIVRELLTQKIKD